MVNKQKTDKVMRHFTPKKTKIATMGGMDLEIPNHSGDNSAGTILKTPVNDNDIPNKKYVDDAITGENIWDRTGTTITQHTANDDLSLGAGDITMTGNIDAGQSTFDGLITDGVLNFTGTTGQVLSNNRLRLTSLSGDIDLEPAGDVDCGTNKVKCGEVTNTAGNLKIEPNIEGDVTVFEDTDVASGTTDGKKFQVFRKIEKDTSVDIYVDQYDRGILEKADDDFVFKAGSTVTMGLAGKTTSLTFSEDSTDIRVKTSSQDLELFWGHGGTGTDRVVLGGTNDTNGDTIYIECTGHTADADGLADFKDTDITTTGDIKGNFQSSDGSQGITQSETGVTDFDIVIKDGLITSFTKN